MEESSCTKYFKQKQSEDELFKLYVEVSWEDGIVNYNANWNAKLINTTVSIIG